MPGEVFVITIVAMCLGFALVKQMITTIFGSPKERARHRARRQHHEVESMSKEEQDALLTRAEDLLRRIETLEEIVASEVTRSERDQEERAEIHSVH